MAFLCILIHKCNSSLWIQWSKSYACILHTCLIYCAQWWILCLIKDVLFDQISLVHTRNCPIHFLNPSTQDLCMISDLLITVCNEVAKVMFLQVSVILSTGTGGGVPGPGGLLWGVPGPGGLVSQHALRQTPPGETPTAADGTLPTGMHSCFTWQYLEVNGETLSFAYFRVLLDFQSNLISFVAELNSNSFAILETKQFHSYRI